MNKEKMRYYLTIPPFPASKQTTTAGRHTIKFRNCLARHLLGLKSPGKISQIWNKYQRISIQHFPPEFRCALLNMASKKELKWRVDLDVGRAAGLTKADLCEDGKNYFAAPIQGEDAIEEELEEAKRTYAASHSHKWQRTIKNDPHHFQTLKKFKAKYNYLPINHNDGLSTSHSRGVATRAVRRSKRLVGQETKCTCLKYGYKNCDHSECKNSSTDQRECNAKNCCFGERDCGNRFTSPEQMKKQSHARYKIEVFKSHIYPRLDVGSGLRAVVDIAEHEIIGEYTGEVKKDCKKDRSNYSVEIDKGLVIDAFQKGNALRYLQHSCEANCELRVRADQDGEKRVWIRASKPIITGDWLTISYSEDKEELSNFFDQKGCVCGSIKCIYPRKRRVTKNEHKNK